MMNVSLQQQPRSSHRISSLTLINQSLLNNTVVDNNIGQNQIPINYNKNSQHASNLYYNPNNRFANYNQIEPRESQGVVNNNSWDNLYQLNPIINGFNPSNNRQGIIVPYTENFHRRNSTEDNLLFPMKNSGVIPYGQGEPLYGNSNHGHEHQTFQSYGINDLNSSLELEN